MAGPHGGTVVRRATASVYGSDIGAVSRVESGNGPADAAAVLDLAACVRMFDEFARALGTRVPLYARLSAGIAADPELAGLVLVAPVSQRQPVLLLACVHDLLLADPSEPLARYYPDLNDEPNAGDPMPAFGAFCHDRAGELEALLTTRRTQTNEVGRCALLLPPLAIVAAEVGPLAHLDVGTSAGLNLLLARFHYRYEPGGDVGPPSPVTLKCGVRGDGPLPTELPQIVTALGIDPVPVDLTLEREARWLRACVWPDQAERATRLQAAMELAADVGLDVRRGEAVADTPRLVAELSATAHPVVTNTWVLNYLSRAERIAYLEALDDVGRRVDFSWVYAESPRQADGVPAPPADDGNERTVLTLVRWRGGQRTVDHLAECHPHGAWLQWR